MKQHRALRSVLATLCAALLSLPQVGYAHETDDSAAAKLDPDFAAGKKAIEAKNWSGAIESFGKAALRDPANADIQNYLGYANRNAGRVDAAFKYYQRALELNPKHRGAHEYIGEAYLLVKNLAKAEEHLAVLDRLCLLPCEEYSDLKAKIAAYKRAGK